MNRCSDYEIELSALFDGEGEPAMALELIEHVARCSSCSGFVRDLRNTQDIVDSLELRPKAEPLPADVATIKLRRRWHLGLRPQWALGIAALLVVTVGILVNTIVGPTSTFSSDLRDGELLIRLEEDKGRMSDERFVAMVSELLRADRRYQNQMYVVLEEIGQGRTSGESSHSHDSDGSDERRERDWSERSSPLNAAMD